jgi:hypothetical protein
MLLLILLLYHIFNFYKTAHLKQPAKAIKLIFLQIEYLRKKIKKTLQIGNLGCYN